MCVCVCVCVRVCVIKLQIAFKLVKNCQFRTRVLSEAFTLYLAPIIFQTSQLKFSMQFFFSPMHATIPFHLTLPYLIVVILLFKSKERTVEVQHSECSFMWCRNLDTSENS